MSDSSENRTRTNVTNRLFGSYQAEVVNTVHPKGLYMVSVRLLGYWDAIPDKDLPFAEFLLPLGAKPSGGHAVPVEKGDLVWVDFPRNGDTRYPRITGSLYYAPNYESYLPSEVNGEAYQPKRADGEPEPPAYDRKDALFVRFGLRELITHQGGYSVTHTQSGTAIEITPDGQCVIHVEGNAFRSSTGNTLEQIGGALTIKVKGDANIEAGGNATVKASGKANLEGNEVTIKASGNVNIDAGGQFAVKASAAPFTLG
ncbi:hypothetical protein R5M54_003433 [Vibrio alginolyticus]|nr:hypothetical protein [Vibrio alginolyticus]EJX2556762.1 hypothetical protein [Vibrio alginolyticus]EKA2634918.1 hypothetical protein [Vibrio alginolyticus]ELA6640823.1 hypothetical protein [Vibrio alginolyticus]ELA7570972.1 hypothetical protein [Vibrio alginolyticus]